MLRFTMELSAEVRALADYLAALPIDALASYADLSEAAGVNVRHRRYLIDSAIRVAEREAGILIANVRNAGYSRVAARDAHHIGARTRRHVRRVTGRHAKRIVRVVETANDLTSEERRHAFAEVNSLSLLRHLASDKAASPAVVGAEKPLPIGLSAVQTMRALGFKAV